MRSRPASAIPKTEPPFEGLDRAAAEFGSCGSGTVLLFLISHAIVLISSGGGGEREHDDDIWAFLEAVGGPWIALVGWRRHRCAPRCLREADETRDPASLLRGLLLASVVTAIYQAWLDEHTRVNELAAQIDKDPTVPSTRGDTDRAAARRPGRTGSSKAIRSPLDYARPVPPPRSTSRCTFWSPMSP